MNHFIICIQFYANKFHCFFRNIFIDSQKFEFISQSSKFEFISQWRLINICCCFFFFSVPSIPTIIHEDCSTVNNSVTVAWKALNPLSNDGYVLELDDGSGGEFRVSWKNEFSISLVFTTFRFPNRY